MAIQNIDTSNSGQGVADTSARNQASLPEANPADIDAFNQALKGSTADQADSENSLMALEDVKTWGDFSLYINSESREPGAMTPAEDAKFKELMIKDMIREQGKRNEERQKELKKELGVF